MAHSLCTLLAVLVRLTTSENVALTGSEGQQSTEPSVHIDAHGAFSAVPSRLGRPEDMMYGLTEGADIALAVERAKERMGHTKETARLVRQEVRRHVPSEQKGVLHEQSDDFDSLVEAEEVTCATLSEKDDPVSTKLCRILHGTNDQVAGKLERAVKGLSLRPSGNKTEMVVADQEEDLLLKHLKASLWDLWFCAKRPTPPCNPMTSDDPKVQAARDAAFDALHAIHMHAAVQPPQHGTAAASGASSGGTAAVPAASGSRGTELDSSTDSRPVPVDSLAALVQTWSAQQPTRIDIDAAKRAGHIQVIGPESLLQQEDDESPVQPDDAAAAATPHLKVVSGVSTFAEKTLNGMLTGTKDKVEKKLMNAINSMDITTVLQDDVVKIKKDESVEMTAMKDNMLLMHECATMQPCTSSKISGCCTPATTTEAKYKTARDDLFKAYHQMKGDDSESKQAYYEMIKSFASGMKTHSKGAQKRAKDSLSTTLYPPENPSYTNVGEPVTPNSTNTTAAAAKPTPAAKEGNLLMIGIIVVNVVVVLAILFLAYKTWGKSSKKGGGGGAPAGEESWGNDDWEGEK